MNNFICYQIEALGDILIQISHYYSVERERENKNNEPNKSYLQLIEDSQSTLKSIYNGEELHHKVKTDEEVKKLNREYLNLMVKTSDLIKTSNRLPLFTREKALLE